MLPKKILIDCINECRHLDIETQKHLKEEITFNYLRIKREQIKALKKFVSGTDEKKERLYIYVNDKKEVYLCSFAISHVYISYLKIGETDQFSGTHFLSGEYKDFKKFLNKVKISDDLLLSIKSKGTEDDFTNTFTFTHLTWSQGSGNESKFTFIADPETPNLDLDFFISQVENGDHYDISKDELKVLELYPNISTCLSFNEGKITFRLYDDGNFFEVVAKHTIKDKYNNTNENYVCIGNEYLLKVLDKFNNKGKFLLTFGSHSPICIRSLDYTGIIAPRLTSFGDLKDNL